MSNPFTINYCALLLLWMLLILATPQVSTAQTSKCSDKGAEYIERVRGWVRNTEDLIEKNPNNINAHRDLGKLLYDLCRYDEAIASYRRAIRLTTDTKFAASVYNEVASLLRDQRKYQDAIASYQQAIKLVGGNGQEAIKGYNGMGLVFKMQGKVEEALIAYRKAFRLLPDPEPVDFSTLEDLLREQNRLQDLVRIYRQEHQHSPNKISIVIELGKILLELKQFSEAEEAYQQALKINASMGTYLGLGDALINQGKRSAAINAYQKAVEIYQPTKSMLDLGSVCNSQWEFGKTVSEQLVEQGLYDLAIKLCRKRLAQASNDDRARNQIGEILLKQGKLREAQEAFKQATTINPNNQKARTNLAEAERLLNQR